MAKASSWKPDERILALDVYFRHDYKRRAELNLDDRRRLKSAIKDLTKVLDNHRAASGRSRLTYSTVDRKLRDFQVAEPPPYTVGDGKYEEDLALWQEYVGKEDQLRAKAQQIREMLENPQNSAAGA
jgi:hypothetical protein